jgi:hypothetical protein
METFSETEINHILNLYKKNVERNKIYYEKVKDTEEFKKKNRARAAAHYEKNKASKKESYSNNLEYNKSRNMYYYYKRLDRVDHFKDKYPERFELVRHLTEKNQA